MPAPERIRITFSPFEKLQILRSELEDRSRELEALEAEIRNKLQLHETQRYLETLSPYYTAQPRQDLPTREEIEALESRRTQLHELIDTIEASIPALLQQAESGGGAPPQPSPAGDGAAPGAPPPGPQAAAGQARKARFESFDDFRKQRGNEG